MEASNLLVKNVSKTKEARHELASDEQRNGSSMSRAIIAEVCQASASVKRFTLNVLDPHFTFLACQWVDVLIPNIDEVCGFSICSSPLLMQKENKIILGVKHSLRPPTLWFHEKCGPGSEILIKVGGDFYFPHEGDERCDLLLIAGGVGCNPIFSIFTHYCELKARNEQGTGKVSFLFSAKTRDELLYKTSIDALASKYPQDIFVQYFTTKDNGEDDITYKNRRMTLNDISAAINRLDKYQTQVYICGPPSLIEDARRHITELKLSSKVYYEKWW